MSGACVLTIRPVHPSLSTGATAGPVCWCELASYSGRSAECPPSGSFMIRASPRYPRSSPVADPGTTDHEADGSPSELAVWWRTKLPERPWTQPTTRSKPT